MFPSLTMEQASLMRLAQDAFLAADAAQEYAGDWWQSGGAPLITLSTDQDMTREQMDAMRERWIELRGMGSSVPAILARGVEAKTFGADLGTSQADTAMERMGSSIARYFGVPPSMVNVRSAYGSMTYSTTEAQGITFARYTLEPYAGAIGDALSDYLPGDYQVGRRISLDLSHLTRGEQGCALRGIRERDQGRLAHPRRGPQGGGIRPAGLVDDRSRPPARHRGTRGTRTRRGTGMTQTTELRPGSVSIRDGESEDGRTLEGTALVYGEPSGETQEYGAGETFARGAFRNALEKPRAVPFFARHGGDMVGAVTFEDSDEALKYRGPPVRHPGRSRVPGGGAGGY